MGTKNDALLVQNGKKNNDAPGKKLYIRNNNVNDAFGINNDTLVINTDAL